MCGALMELVKFDKFLKDFHTGHGEYTNLFFFSHERHEPMLRYFMGYPHIFL